MVTKMIDLGSIIKLLDMLFKDMKQDQDDLNDKGQHDDSEEEEQPVKKEEDLEEEGDNEEEQQSEIDSIYADRDAFEQEEEVVARKGILTIERIKDIIGSIIQSCKSTYEYDMLQYLLFGKIFQKRVLRESFLQEIMTSSMDNFYSQALEVYANTDD